jgi:HlyD family secretion protein
MYVRRSLIFFTIMALALPLLSFGMEFNRSESQTASRNIQYHTVRVGQLDVAILATGSVESATVAQLNFQRPGRIVEIMVQAGDYVLAGDPLMRLDTSDEELALSAAQLDHALALLRKEQVVNPDNSDRVRIAEAQLQSAWGAYIGLQNAVAPGDIQAAEVRYQQAIDAHARAVEARTTAQGGQPDEAYLLLDAQVGQASFQIEIARLQLESLRQGNSGQLGAAYARVIVAQRELDQAMAGPTASDIERADIDIRRAELGVSNAQAELSRMILTAPFDGIVSAVNREVGALSTGLLPPVELTDVARLRVDVQVDEVDIRQAREGMLARLRFDALPGLELTARLDQIGLVGTNDNGVISYPVRLLLDQTDPRVRVGMTADASIIVETRSEVLTIPNQYIRLDRDTGLAFVNRVANDGTFTEIEITLGLQGADSSEVVNGLRAGDLIGIDLSSDSIGFGGG